MTRLFQAGSLMVVAMVCVAMGYAQTDSQTQSQAKPAHTRATAAKKKAPAALPSGPLGPLPQFPLDSMPAVPPHVSFHDGQLTIETPNSTLGDVLRAVHTQTLADMDIPAGATDRVALHLGPGPAREVVATLLNGSRFNYVLLGAPSDPEKLVRIVLVAKVNDAPKPAEGQETAQANAQPQPAQDENADNGDNDADNSDDQQADQQAAQPEPQQQQQQPANDGRSPAQMMQEMQQRQLLMMQQLQQQQQQNNGQAPQPQPNQTQPQPNQPQD